MLLLLLNAVTFAVVLRALRDNATGHIGGARHLRTIERVAALLLVVIVLRKCGNTIEINLKKLVLCKMGLCQA